MSELKCPFCNQKLEPIGTSGQFQCGTWGCDASFNFIATRDVWEYIDRTRKALYAAVDALKRIAGTNKECDIGWKMIEMKNNAHDTLNQIKTALEQKDVK